jgi:hypothetical protein
MRDGADRDISRAAGRADQDWIVLSSFLPRSGLGCWYHPNSLLQTPGTLRWFPDAGIGCMLSRVRTGMFNKKMTCAIPGARLAGVAQKIKTTTVIDGTLANCASKDSRRFEKYR